MPHGTQGVPKRLRAGTQRRVSIQQIIHDARMGTPNKTALCFLKRWVMVRFENDAPRASSPWLSFGDVPDSHATNGLEEASLLRQGATFVGSYSRRAGERQGRAPISQGSSWRAQEAGGSHEGSSGYGRVCSLQEGQGKRRDCSSDSSSGWSTSRRLTLGSLATGWGVPTVRALRQRAYMMSGSLHRYPSGVCLIACRI